MQELRLSIRLPFQHKTQHLPFGRGRLERPWLRVYGEKEMATHSSILAWGIPGTEEPGGLPSMGSHRVGHNWSDLAIAVGQNRKILCWSPTPKTSYCSALGHYQGLWESLELILSWCLQKRHALPMPWTQISSLHNCCLVAQLYLILCDHMDCNPSGSYAHQISQARILEWVAIFSSRGSSWSRDQTHVFCVSCIVDRFFTAETLGKSKNSLANIST